MLKVLAVLRTLYLVFIVVFTLRGMPIWGLTRTFDEQYARCSSSLGMVTSAAWLAIAWIGFETALGWWLASRRPKKPAAAVPPPDAATG
ncbi:MAG TPA: hypothetical protein VFG59_17275 [Anaeromyxobacter sp.]|nr:hypothetical protein [Anaeromyxobacter sp.]